MKSGWLAVWVLCVAMLLAVGACSNDDDDNDSKSDDVAADDAADDTAPSDDAVDDAADDLVDDAADDSADDAADDTSDDAADDTGTDDDIVFTPWNNPDAKADAFKLFYSERLSRELLAFNRFSIVNDVVPGQLLDSTSIAKTGDDYEMALHPIDNNSPGFAAFDAYQMYTIFGSRELALTLIRMFEGLYVYESISGHQGLTCREWLPGWTLTIDGDTGDITRTHDGGDVTPGETYPADLEQEVVDTFFQGGHWTYRADPTESYFALEPILATGSYLMTFVFEEMPNFLRVSDCCSSYMVSKLGPFQDYFWGNHNSRDNYPDFAIGYFAARDCATSTDPDIPADLKASCVKADESGKRVGDNVVSNGYNLMTVGEYESYDDLIVAGSWRPGNWDEGPEWLGSMNSCQMSYMSKALSSAGLQSPTETVETPGSYELIAIKQLFDLLGIPSPITTWECTDIDQAYLWLNWGDILNMTLFDQSIFDILNDLLYVLPDDVAPILKDLVGALDQPEMAAVALTYYAIVNDRVNGNPELLQASRETLYHLLEIHRLCSQMLLDWANTQSPPPSEYVNFANEKLYVAAMWAHYMGVGDELYSPAGFTIGQDKAAYVESVLTRSDSTPRALMTDEQIQQIVTNELSGERQEVVDRYNALYSAAPPLRRFGDHYEAVGLDGNFHEIPNITHQWFGGSSYGKALLFEAPLCNLAPTVLDCSWALLGCERPDLDASKTVDASDQTLFDAAWTTFGDGASCDAGNTWCDGADLDRSGILNTEDQAFMTAAQGCWY